MLSESKWCNAVVGSLRNWNEEYQEILSIPPSREAEREARLEALMADFRAVAERVARKIVSELRYGRRCPSMGFLTKNAGYRRRRGRLQRQTWAALREEIRQVRPRAR